MVAANKHRQVGCDLLATVVLVEHAETFILGRAMHVIHIFLIPQGLEISTDEQSIDFYLPLFLHLLQFLVDAFQLAMQAALHSNLSQKISTFME